MVVASSALQTLTPCAIAATGCQFPCRSALPPAELSNAIYPLLASWVSNEEPAFPRHSLSRAAVEMSGEKVRWVGGGLHDRVLI